MASTPPSEPDHHYLFLFLPSPEPLPGPSPLPPSRRRGLPHPPLPLPVREPFPPGPVPSLFGIITSCFTQRRICSGTVEIQLTCRNRFLPVSCLSRQGGSSCIPLLWQDIPVPIRLESSQVAGRLHIQLPSPVQNRNLFPIRIFRHGPSPSLFLFRNRLRDRGACSREHHIRRSILLLFLSSAPFRGVLFYLLLASLPPLF